MKVMASSVSIMILFGCMVFWVFWYPTNCATYVPFNAIGIETDNNYMLVDDGVETLYVSNEFCLMFGMKRGAANFYFRVVPIYEGENPILSYLRFYNPHIFDLGSHYSSQIKSITVSLNNGTEIAKSSTEPMDDFTVYPNVAVNDVDYIKAEISGLVFKIDTNSEYMIWIVFIGLTILLFVCPLLITFVDFGTPIKNWRMNRKKRRDIINVIAASLGLDANSKNDLGEMLIMMYKRDINLTGQMGIMKNDLDNTKELLDKQHKELTSRGKFCHYCGANLEEDEEESTTKGENDTV